MAGLRKERGRERGLWFPRLARTDSPTAVAEGREECKARRETEPELNQESAHLGACLLNQFPCLSIGLPDIKEAANRPIG